MHTASKIAVSVSIFFIRIYQKFLSPDHSFWRFIIQRRICRFHPTCSDYAIIALKNKGFFKGWRMAIVRVSKCHPWNPGGYDPIE